MNYAERTARHESKMQREPATAKALWRWMIGLGFKDPRDPWTGKAHVAALARKR